MNLCTRRSWWAAVACLGGAVAVASGRVMAQQAEKGPNAAGKKPAILVLMHRAVDGPPASDARMKHFALPDPKLAAKFRDLGFEIGVAPYASGMDMDYLKQFNVVVVPQPIIPGSSPGLEHIAAEKKKLVLDYVKEGGGLLVLRVTGWQFGKDIDAVNSWLVPCGVEILSEQVKDDENKLKLESGYELSWTDNVTPHPVTDGVGGIFYTTYHHMYSDSTSALKTGKGWTVLLRGMKTAKSLKTVKGGKPPPPAPGTYSSEPPLLAVRGFGKGRVAVWPLNATCVWQDGYHTLWGKGLTMEGVRSGMRGDAARLLTNLMIHLAEPTRGTFGGYMPPPTEAKVEVGFRRIDWGNAGYKGAYMPNCFVGLIGAKSALSSGTGTPEQFIQTAKEAGYDFIAFADDLDKLTEETYGQLQDICSKASSEMFRAYAGFSFLDDSGNSWVTFSDRLRWPEKGWWSTDHPGRIKINNPLSRGCQWPPLILIKSHSNPEKACFQGNFKVISLYTYENGKLVDDSRDVYLRLQRMRYGLCPAAVHIVTSPDEVKRARNTGFQTYTRWFDNNMADALSGHVGRYGGKYVFTRSCFVSEGPILEDARITNFATSDLALPENDRIRIHVRVSAPAGLREVKILNGDHPRPWRRFLPGGKTELDVTIDHFHDRQYDFIVEATDVNGKRAVGWDAWTAVQENSFPRCSDNINTMPRGKWWGQPQDMQNVRGIENYLAVRNFRYMGLPLWSGVDEGVRPAVEYYPFLVSRFGTILDCIITDHYPPTIDGNPDRTDRAELATPNEHVSGTVRHTLFTPWQDGSLIVLVEGEFKVLKPFKLERSQVAAFHGRERADCICATLKDGTLFAGRFIGTKGSYSAELPANGFAAAFPQPYRGSVGLIPLQDGLRYHAFRGGGEHTNFRALLSGGPREARAGETLSYRYLGVISKLDPPPHNTFITDIVKTLGVRGSTAYAVQPARGSIESMHFVLRLTTEGHGFAGTVTQADLPLHLPVFVKGLNPRWHAGIWYRGRNRFMVAEWVVNEMNQRWTVRRHRTEKDTIHHFPVMADGTGMLQVDTALGDKDVYIGNLLVSDNPNVCLTLVDWRPKRAAFVAHNPTDDELTCTVRPGPGFSLLGEFEIPVTVPAGASVRASVSQ